jgi:replicative DNA helicase
LTSELPHSIEAEAAVLGSLLIDNEQFQGLELTAADFYQSENKVMYGAMRGLRDQGKPVDQLTVGTELKRLGKLQDVGGVAYLSRLVAGVPTSLNCNYYAQMVKELAGKRSLIQVAGVIAEAAYNGVSLTESLNQSMDLITAIKKQHHRMELIGGQDLRDKMFEVYADLKDKADTVYVPTGIGPLDYQLNGGTFAGQLVVVGAGSEEGKSTFGLAVANNAQNKGPVLYASTEMPFDQLGHRMMASMTNIPIGRLMRGGNYTQDDWARINDGLESLTPNKIMFYDGFQSGGLTVRGIEAAADQIATRYGHVRLIVVDYLQDLKSDNGRDNRYEVLGGMCRDLSIMAKKYQCPLLLLCQINTRQQNKDRPSKSSLYESGKIEQSADVILLLYRIAKHYNTYEYAHEFENHPEWSMYDRNEYPADICEIIIDKQRQADCGQGQRIVRVRYDRTGYKELSRKDN